MALRGEKIAAPIKFILFGKDKARYDFYILLFFYVAIFLILAGPYILFQSLLYEKLSGVEISIDILNFLFSTRLTIRPLLAIMTIAVIIGVCMVKVSLYSAVSSLTYKKHEVLEAFKDGMRGIVRFKAILGALIAYENGGSILLWVTKGAAQDALTLISYLMPALVMLLMSCSYSLADNPRPPASDVKDAVSPALGGGLEKNAR